MIPVRLVAGPTNYEPTVPCVGHDINVTYACAVGWG